MRRLTISQFKQLTDKIKHKIDRLESIPKGKYGHKHDDEIEGRKEAYKTVLYWLECNQLNGD